MLKVPYGQDPYSVIGKYIRDHITAILDTLIAYRKITQHGDCNDCGRKLKCMYVPKPGECVRWNCPFFERIGEADGQTD